MRLRGISREKEGGRKGVARERERVRKRERERERKRKRTRMRDRGKKIRYREIRGERSW